MPLQIRRGTNDERIQMNQPLAAGEPLYVTDTQRLYIGNGTTIGGIAVTGYTNEDAIDAIGAALVAGNHTGITFTYGQTQDNANRIDAAVNLSNYSGTITADAFRGTFVSDDSTIIIDGVTKQINGNVSGNLTGNVTGNVTGNLTGDVTGNLTGNVTGNITGNLSGIVTGSLVGSVDGDVTGSVFSDASTLLVDGVSGLITGDVDNNTITTGSIILNKDLVAGGVVVYSQSSLEDDVDLFNFITAHNDASSSGITFTRSRGTIASSTALSSNDKVFALVFAGQSTTDVEQTARIDVSLDGAPGAGIVPGKIALSTADDAGVMTERLTVNSKGTSEFKGMVQLPTYADESAATSAVGTPLNGMMYYDSGAGKIKGYQSGAWVVLQP